jgi:hypothetical protein
MMAKSSRRNPVQPEAQPKEQKSNLWLLKIPLTPVIPVTWEDPGLRPVWTISSRNPISKVTKAKWVGKAVECLLCKLPPPKKKVKFLSEDGYEKTGR